eukprot:3240500-Alexandrium_andersonii.AAC.1
MACGERLDRRVDFGVGETVMLQLTEKAESNGYRRCAVLDARSHLRQAPRGLLSELRRRLVE